MVDPCQVKTVAILPTALFQQPIQLLIFIKYWWKRKKDSERNGDGNISTLLVGKYQAIWLNLNANQQYDYANVQISFLDATEWKRLNLNFLRLRAEKKNNKLIQIKRRSLVGCVCWLPMGFSADRFMVFWHAICQFRIPVLVNVSTKVNHFKIKLSSRQCQCHKPKPNRTKKKRKEIII